MTDAPPDTSALRRFLLAGRNADGGWGYYPGKASRLEPTCWGLLALRDLDASVLATWPADKGLLRERRDGGTNLGFHALALLTLASRHIQHTEGNARLVNELQQTGGVALPPAQHNRQNNSLRGWSWIDGSFSWVEPTSWALLALRNRAAAGAPTDLSRLNEAEALLVDRCCEGGGWNYGNSNMLGKELRPYVPTTAVALLALQKRAIPVVTKSLAYLDRAAVSESSALALSLAVLALGAHGHSADAARALLVAEAGRAIDLGHQLGAAMALYTLQTETADGAFAL